MHLNIRAVATTDTAWQAASGNGCSEQCMHASSPAATACHLRDLTVHQHTLAVDILWCLVLHHLLLIVVIERRVHVEQQPCCCVLWVKALLLDKASKLLSFTLVGARGLQLKATILSTTATLAKALLSTPLPGAPLTTIARGCQRAAEAGPRPPSTTGSKWGLPCHVVHCRGRALRWVSAPLRGVVWARAIIG